MSLVPRKIMFSSTVRHFVWRTYCMNKATLWGYVDQHQSHSDIQVSFTTGTNLVTILNWNQQLKISYSCQFQFNAVHMHANTIWPTLTGTLSFNPSITLCSFSSSLRIVFISKGQLHPLTTLTRIPPFKKITPKYYTQIWCQIKW